MSKHKDSYEQRIVRTLTAEGADEVETTLEAADIAREADKAIADANKRAYNAEKFCDTMKDEFAKLCEDISGDVIGTIRNAVDRFKRAVTETKTIEEDKNHEV